MTSLNLTVGKTFDLSELEDNHIIQLGRGLVISKEDMLNTVGDYPVYSSSATGNGEFGRYGKYMFDDERITWSIDGGGRLFYRHKHCYSVTNVCGWLKVFNNLLSTKYVYYNLIYQWQFIKFDYTFKAHPSKIRDIYKIHYLNYDEQLKIVKQLDIVQQIIDLRTQQLSHFDELIKARFVEMFGDLENNTKGWYIQQLEELCKISSSKRIYRKEQSDFGVPFLRIADLMDKINNGITKSELFISAEKYNELCLLGLVPKKGDILLTARGTLGKCYIIQNDDKFYFQDGMITWLSDFSNNITALFLKYLFSTDWLQKQINELQAGSTVAYLSIAMTKKLYIPLPPIDLQNEFAEFVKQIDKSKFIIENLTARRLFYA